MTSVAEEKIDELRETRGLAFTMRFLRAFFAEDSNNQRLSEKFNLPLHTIVILRRDPDAATRKIFEFLREIEIARKIRKSPILQLPQELKKTA